MTARNGARLDRLEALAERAAALEPPRLPGPARTTAAGLAALEALLGPQPEGAFVVVPDGEAELVTGRARWQLERMIGGGR